MKRLRVVLVHRDADHLIQRSIGWWSYPVDEFTWTHVRASKGFQLNVRELARAGDLILYEDGKLYGRFLNRGEVPIAYHVVDSTLSADHYKVRLQQATQCNLILLDHDRKERFAHLGKPVYQWPYCVNDRVFRDHGLKKDVDVCFHAHLNTPERQRLHEWLSDWCRRQGYHYAAGERYGLEYAQSFNRAKIAINLARTEINRPHRVFDVMASRCCLLTSPLPDVDNETRRPGDHYAIWRDYDELAEKIVYLLATGQWEEIADRAYKMTHELHTWRVRARQLRTIVAGVFPWLT